MRMLKLLLLLGAMLTPWLLLAAGKVMVTPPMKVQVQVDAQGHLSDITPMKKLSEPFAGVVQRTLAGWTFYPARVDGKPVITRTWLTIELKALPRENGDVGVQVVYLSNGPDVVMAYPSYPEEMIRVLREAKISVQATVGLDGRLSDPGVVEALTTNGGRAEKFVDAVLAAVKKSRASPIIVDGQPVVSHIRIPFNFDLSRDGHTVGTPADLRRAQDSVKYVVVGSEPPAVFSEVGDYAVALDSPVRPLNTPGG